MQSLYLRALLLVLALAGCGSGEPALATFPALSKTEGDAPFSLTAPTSDSPGAFNYTSSDNRVATISGNIVTVVRAGTSTITASQAAAGSYKSSSTTALLTVTARNCIAPATRQDGLCIAPPATGSTLTRAGRIWMPVNFLDTWSNANAYCTTTIINGQTDWRLPSEFELSDLYSTGAMNNQGWTLSRTWSSTAGVLPATTTAATRQTVHLNDGKVTDELTTNSAYIACIRQVE